MRVTRFLKYTVGLFYVIGGPLIHAYLIANRRELYGAVADSAWSAYQLLWLHFVLPNLAPLVILLVLFEMAVGTLMLSPHKHWTEVGHLGGLLFNLLLIPFWFAYGIPNALLVLIHAWLFYEERQAMNGQVAPTLVPVGQQVHSV